MWSQFWLLAFMGGLPLLVSWFMYGIFARGEQVVMRVTGMREFAVKEGELSAEKHAALVKVSLPMLWMAAVDGFCGWLLRLAEDRFGWLLRMASARLPWLASVEGSGSLRIASDRFGSLRTASQVGSELHYPEMIEMAAIATCGSVCSVQVASAISHDLPRSHPDRIPISSRSPTMLSSAQMASRGFFRLPAPLLICFWIAITPISLGCLRFVRIGILKRQGVRSLETFRRLVQVVACDLP